MIPDTLGFPLHILLILLGGAGWILTTGGKIGDTQFSDGQAKYIKPISIGTLFVGIIWTLGIYIPAPTPPFPVTPITVLIETQAPPTETSIAEEPTILPTSTTEPKLPTQTPIETAVMPTDTPPSTDTPEPPPTSEPATSISDIIQVQSLGGDIWVYAGADTINIRLGDMKQVEKGIVLGKDRWENWVKVETEREVVGWVQLEKVTFISGAIEDVPVAWPLSGSGLVAVGTQTSSSCINVTLSTQDWPSQHFDDIWLQWSNVSDETTSIKIEITGDVDGSSTALIFPTYSDVSEAEYYIGYWKFVEKGFPKGVTFTYSVSAIAADNTQICTTFGTFTQ